MPRRKAKEIQIIQETPVVFFLKIVDENSIVDPAEQNTNYSDILNSVETSKGSERFNTDLLKSILDKVFTDKYSPQTACFWCCHAFNWIACILPKSYDAYKNLYLCEGNFCSPECALSYCYNDSKTSESTKWIQHALLGSLYSEIYKTRILSPAPPRSLLRLFGGPLDIEQYREYITNSNDIVLSEMYPIRLTFPSMNVQGPLRDIKKYVSLSTDSIEKASEQLRLKRSKPVSTNIQTLDMCIMRSH
jgi:hypothetical protein